MERDFRAPVECADRMGSVWMRRFVWPVAEYLEGKPASQRAFLAVPALIVC
jgi:hypothetical protein